MPPTRRSVPGCRSRTWDSSLEVLAPPRARSTRPDETTRVGRRLGGPGPGKAETGACFTLSPRGPAIPATRQLVEDEHERDLA